jgi:hypothetical protein
MNKLELELKRLDKFLIQIDKVISGMLETEGFDTQDLSTVMGVRSEVIKRKNEIYSIQRNTEFWKDYHKPTRSTPDFSSLFEV